MSAHSLGLFELREAIAEDYWEKYHVNISPEQVLVAVPAIQQAGELRFIELSRHGGHLRCATPSLLSVAQPWPQVALI